MAEEIEQHLLQKLNEAIKEAESNEQYLLAKLAPLQSQFVQLKQLLENKTSPSLAADGSNLRREKLYYLNNVLIEWQMISKNQSSYSPETLRFTYNLSRSLKKIKKELKGGDVIEAPNRLNSPPPLNTEARLPKELGPYRWSSRHIDATKIHGLDDKLLSMERLIILHKSDDPFKAIGFVGMAGVGKTTLCQLIFNWPKVKQHFLPRIWVCMSKQPNEDSDNRKEIVRRILTCLGVEEEIIKVADESHGLRGLLFALRLQLMGKRYLIVLDDSWNMDKFFEKLSSESAQDEKWGEQFEYGLPKGCGGTVIVTSRAKEVAKNMVGEEENLHFLVPLSDTESCWLIFKDSVEEDGKKFPQYLENLKVEIVKKCAGLPLAAKMMGKIVNEQIREFPDASANHQELQKITS